MQRLSSDMTRNFLGKTLEPVTSAKDLGVIIYSHLTYNAHIRKVVSSCMAKLCQINKVKDCFDRNTLLLIISALVLSKVTYCSTVWSNPSASNIKKLQAVQNSCAELCVQNCSTHREIWAHHSSPSPTQMATFTTTVTLRGHSYDAQVRKWPRPWLLLQQVSQMCRGAWLSDTESRPAGHPFRKSAAGQSTFRYRSTKIWNELAKDLKDSPTYTSFKRNLKRHLISQFLSN